MPIVRAAPAQNGGVWLGGGRPQGWTVWPGGDREPPCQLITHRDSQMPALPENSLPWALCGTPEGGKLIWGPNPFYHLAASLICIFRISKKWASKAP